MNTKPELKNEYDEYVKVNSNDEYSKECVRAGDMIAAVLDEHKSPREALDTINGVGLTGFMATMAVKAVVHFHPRGEEVRHEWNKDWGREDLQDGIVNPSVLTAGKDGTLNPDIESV